MGVLRNVAECGVACALLYLLSFSAHAQGSEAAKESGPTILWGDKKDDRQCQRQ
jgi:hypothetical protein